MASAQRRVWFTEQVFGPSAVNNLVLGMRLAGPLDRAALELALLLMVRRHDVFRTSFDVIGGRPVQCVHSEGGPFFRVTDLTQHPEPEQAAYAAACDSAHAPFDLSAGPPLRVALLSLGDEHHVLICTIHHIIADGWSLQLFAQELTTRYTAIREGVWTPVPALPLQFADYAAWEQAWLESAPYQAQLARCVERLVGTPLQPTLRGALENQSEPGVDGTNHTIRLSQQLVEDVSAAAMLHRATSFAVYLAAFKTLLWRLSGRNDQVVGIPTAGRGRVEVENIIGLFSNLVVARVNFSSDPTLTEIVARTRSAVLDALADEDVPFDRLVQALHPARSKDGNPIFQILFASVPSVGNSASFGGLTVTPYIIETVAVPFELSMNLIEEPSGAVWLRVEYRTNRFSARQIAALLESYVETLTVLTKSPNTRVSQLGAVSDAWVGAAECSESVSSPPRPASPVEVPLDPAWAETLREIWSRTLQCGRPSLEANFFELGGDSLQAIIIAHEGSRALSRQIPVSLVFREPTIAGMVRWLAEENHPNLPTPLSLSGGRPPLFLCGSEQGLRDLRRALEPVQPCYQFDVFEIMEHRLLANEPLFASVADVADAFVADMIRLHPEGPYFLAGQCEGSIVALEAAVRLQACGRRVALLVQFDTPVNGYFEPIPWLRFLGTRRLLKAADLLVNAGISGLYRKSVAVFRRSRGLVTPEQSRLVFLWSSIWRMVSAYRQTALYAGEIQFFRAEQRTWIYRDFALGWETRALRLRVHDVPGNHGDLLTNAETRARFNEVLERALADAA